MQSSHHIIEKEHDLMINQIGPLKKARQAHTNSIDSLAVHPNNEIFATGSHDRTIKIWNLEKFKETMTLSDHKQGVWSLNYSKDGSLLASASPDKSVLIWETKKSSPGIKLNAHKDKVHCARFNETSKLLGTCGQQGELFIWDLAKTKEPLARINVPAPISYDIKWSGKEDMFFVTTLGSQVLAYDSKTFKQVCSDQVTKNDNHSKCETVEANFKQIDNRIFVGTSRGAIAWYEIKGGKFEKCTEWISHMDSVRRIVFHPSKKIFLSTGRDGSAKLWNASEDSVQPTLLGNLTHHIQNIPGAGFIGNQMVLTGSWDQDLCLWNIKDLIK